jgi:hypothetical protein
MTNDGEGTLSAPQNDRTTTHDDETYFYR